MVGWRYCTVGDVPVVLDSSYVVGVVTSCVGLRSLAQCAWVDCCVDVWGGPAAPIVRSVSGLRFVSGYWRVDV